VMRRVWGCGGSEDRERGTEKSTGGSFNREQNCTHQSGRAATGVRAIDVAENGTRQPLGGTLSWGRLPCTTPVSRQPAAAHTAAATQSRPARAIPRRPAPVPPI
jgi:hypothetical protein